MRLRFVREFVGISIIIIVTVGSIILVLAFVISIAFTLFYGVGIILGNVYINHTILRVGIISLLPWREIYSVSILVV